jgi:hypothetical protein
MLTIIVILAIWLVLSLPMSVVLGFSFRDTDRLELVGMDGDVAVFRRPNGVLERVPLGDRTSY